MTTSAFRRITSTALAVAALATFSGCASMVSDADLNAQGRATFEKMRAEVPLVRDRPTIEFVSCVADAIVMQLDGEAADYEWELAIFDQQPVNAFVLPGGKISVYKGLLGITKNDAQLAAVMGHEVAHVTQRHPAERMARTKATQVGVGVLSGIVGGTPIAARSASTALQIGAQLGLLLPFNRGQENEADSVGLMYMAKAGFDPRESIKLWQNMQNSKDNEPPEFMSTHPSSDTRIDRLVDLLPAALLEYNKARSAGLRPNCPRPSYLDPPKKPAGKT